MEYCGIDAHQKYSQICILDEDGGVVQSSRVTSTPRALGRFFGHRRRMRVALEAGGSSPWISRLLGEAGHEVVVCNPRRVRLIADSTMKNDEVDAETLARLVRVDPQLLAPIHHRGERMQRLKSELKVRSQLVRSRTRSINAVRGILRAFGHRVPKRSTHLFAERMEGIEIPPELREVVTPLVEQAAALTEAISACDERLAAKAVSMPEVALLRTIPGVGLIIALYFVASIEDPSRFSSSRDVASFFGLNPSLRSSGEVVHHGRITREGDGEMRQLLVQAAYCHLASRGDSELKRWAKQLEGRRGKAKRAVALARKLAVLMHRMWVTGEEYHPFPRGHRVAA